MIYFPDHPAAWAMVFTAGAVIGSFLNVVIYRWPEGESIIRPPSHCTSCGARLGLVDLVPVLSYLWLRGRCRHCGRRFSPRYALVEGLTGLLLVGAVANWALSWHALVAFVVCACLVVVAFIDLDHMVIPDELVMVIALCGVGLNAYDLVHFGVGAPGQGTHALAFAQEVGSRIRVAYLPSSMVGLAVGGGAFLLISALFERIFHKPVMGFGDVKLAAAMGALFGPGYLFAAWFLVSVMVGALVAVVLMAARVRKRGEYIPFGPMLAAGGVLVLLYPQLGDYVLGLYGV